MLATYSRLAGRLAWATPSSLALCIVHTSACAAGSILITSEAASSNSKCWIFGIQKTASVTLGPHLDVGETFQNSFRREAPVRSPSAFRCIQTTRKADTKVCKVCRPYVSSHNAPKKWSCDKVPPKGQHQSLAMLEETNIDQCTGYKVFLLVA